MNGINILETIKLVTYPYERLGVALVVITFVGSVTLFLHDININKKWTNKNAIFRSILFCLALVISFCIGIYNVPTGEYEYKCTIDDDITMGEFTERYDIIDATMNENGIVEFRVKEK